MLAPLEVQAPPGERHVWAQLQLRWSGGEHQVRLYLHFTAKAAAAAAAEVQKLKKQAVWVRMHLQGRRGRGRGRGLETLEISETTTEEDEGEEVGGEAMQEELLRLKLGAIKLVSDFNVNQH